MGQKRGWKLLLIGALIAGVLAGLPLASSQLAAQERAQRLSERMAAEERWTQSGITRYTLMIEENGCRYTSHVRGDLAAIDGLQFNCTFQPSSVASLFDLLKRDGVVERLCDTRGCPCESWTSVRGVYDPQRGYPSRVMVDVDLHPAWLSADLWRNLLADLALPPCVTHNLSDIRVLRLDVNQ